MNNLKMKTASILSVFLLVATLQLRAEMVTNVATATMNPLQDATVSLAKFDSSLGTLTGIYIEFGTALYGTDYAFDNDLTVLKKPTVTISLDVLSLLVSVGLEGTGIGADGSDLNIFAFHQFSLAKDDGDATGQFNTGGADYGRWLPGTLNAMAGGYVTNNAFTDYIGNENFTATINSDISAAITTWTGVESSPNNTLPVGEFFVKVVYEYTAIPEPAAIGLLSLGGIFTLTTSWIRRRLAHNPCA